MNSMRKIFSLLAAIAFAAFAVPAMAQNVKYFELKQTFPNPANAMPVTTTSVTVTFKNIDNGNSSFNSIGIKGYFKTGTGTIEVLSAVSSPGATGAPLNIGDGYFYLTNAGPFKKGQTMTVAMTVKITNTSASGCDSQTIAWRGRAFTGSPSQPATEFQQTNADPVVTVTMGCNYSYTITDKIYKGDKDKTLTATVSNAAGSNASIGSISLTAPAGISASAFSPSGFPIAAGGSGTVDVTASAPCDATGSGGAWTSSVAGFAYPPTGGEKSTAVKGNCLLGFVTPPSSMVPGEEFRVTIKLYNDDSGSTITSFTGKVTVVVDGSGCSVVGDPSLDAALGVATLRVTLNADATATTCSIKAKTTIGSTDFFSSKLSLTVFDGTLACRDGIPDALSLPLPATMPPTSFDESAGGATAPGQTGFVAGVRGRGDKDPCGVDINYAVYNNVPTASTGTTMTDPLGNKVPPGFYSFTWDANQVEKPIIAIIATYKPEWGDAAAGLPTHKTLICTIVPIFVTGTGWVGCTSAPYIGTGDTKTINTAGGWKAAPACLSTLVTHTSLPTGEIGCVASERWDVVAASKCEGSPPTGAVPPEGRCLKPTSIMIMGKDPVFGR